MTISALPPITYPIDKTLFPSQVDAFIPALSVFVTEVNATAAALNMASTNDTSTSSVAISAGSKSFTVSAGKSYVAGMWLLMADAAAPGTNSMVGQVTSYSGTSLVVSVEATGVRGSGTLASWVISLTAMPSGAGIKQIQSIDYAFSSGALILKLNPTNRDYRSTTLTSGTPVNVSNASQLTLTISSSSTLGTVSGVQSDIAIISINNAGTMELAAVNLAGGATLDETGLITTVAEGGAGAADSATVFYSNTSRTGVAYRLEGIFRSTQTTAGTWAQTPTLVQGIGGRALANLLTTSMVRVNTANGFGSTATAIRRFTNIVTNTGSDITYADSATLGGTFTVNTSGVYSVSYSAGLNNLGQRIGVSLNASNLTVGILSLPIAEQLAAAYTIAANYLSNISATVYLPAGSVIRCQDDAPSGAVASIFSITRVDK